jgi:ribosomal protein L37E
MRSLGSIRARVERLASACAPSPETVFICHEQSVERCPACNYDLMAHARAAAWVEAVKGRDRPPPFVHVLPEHLTCPRCGATLPS